MRGAPLYQRHLGAAWDALPEPIRRMHEIGDRLVATGEAEVVRGGSPGARLAAMAIGVPAAGERVPVTVEFRRVDGGEHWRRSFAGRVFESLQSEGKGGWRGLIRERFGPIAVGIRCRAENGRMVLEVRRWSVLGAPMPAALAPYGEAYESAADGRFHFHVEMRHAWTGLIVRYRGWLEPTAPALRGAS